MQRPGREECKLNFCHEPTHNLQSYREFIKHRHKISQQNMFEKILVPVLQQVLGEYFENFEAQQFQLSIWKGELKLEGLEIRKEIFVKLGLPLQVVGSQVGRVHVLIPWNNFTNAPLKVTISSCFIRLKLLENITQIGIRDPAEIQLIVLEQLRTKCIKQLQLADQADRNRGYFDKLIVKIIENIHIQIEDIHLVIEDHFLTSSIVRYGVVLKRFECSTVDHEGKQAFLDRTHARAKKVPLRKACRVEKLGIYWESGVGSGEKLLPIPGDLSKYLFLLSCHVNYRDEPELEGKGITVSLELDSFELKCSNDQLKYLISFSKFLSYYAEKRDAEEKPLAPSLNGNEQEIMQGLLLKVPLKQSLQNLPAETAAILREMLSRTSASLYQQTITNVVLIQHKAATLQAEQIKQKNWLGYRLHSIIDRFPTTQVDDNLLNQLEDDAQIDNALVQELQQSEPAAQTLIGQIKLNECIIIVKNSATEAEAIELKLSISGITLDVESSKILDIKLAIMTLNAQLLRPNKVQLLEHFKEGEGIPYLQFSFSRNKELQAEVAELVTGRALIRYNSYLINMIADSLSVLLKDDEVAVYSWQKLDRLKNGALELKKRVQFQKGRKEVKIYIHQIKLEYPIDGNHYWLISPGDLLIKGEAWEQNASFDLSIKDINLQIFQTYPIDRSASKQAEEQMTRVVDNFEINTKLMIRADRSVNINLSKINCFINPYTINFMRKTMSSLQNESRTYKLLYKPNDKKKLMISAIKVGPLYYQSYLLTTWTKYICVLCDTHLYFFKSPKDQKYSFKQQVANSTIQEMGLNEYSLIVLKIKNKNSQYEYEIGINQNKSDWMTLLQDLAQKGGSSVTQPQSADDEAGSVIPKRTYIEAQYESISVSLLNDCNDPFLIYTTKEAKFCIEIEPFKTRLICSLASINLLDYVHSYQDTNLQGMLKFSDKETVVNLEIEKISRQSEHYQNKDIVLKFELGNLQLNYKPKVISYILQWLKRVTESPPKRSETGSQDSQQMQEEQQQPEEFLEDDHHRILFYSDLSIRQLSIVMVHAVSQVSVMSVHYEKGRIQYSKLCDEHLLELSLGNMIVYDLSNYPNTIYEESDFFKVVPQQLVGIQDTANSLLTVQTKFIESGSRKSQQIREFFQLQVEVSSIHVEFKCWPSFRMLKYLRDQYNDYYNYFYQKVGKTVEDLKLKNLLQTDGASDSCKDKVLALLQNPYKIKLRLKIESPKVTIPSDYSENKLLLDLGCLSFSNYYIQHPQFSWRQVYEIQIKSIGAMADLGVNNQKAMASELNLNLKISYPAFVSQMKSLSMEFDEVIYYSVQISSFILDINQHILELFLEISSTIKTQADIPDQSNLLLQRQSRIKPSSLSSLGKAQVQKQIVDSPPTMRQFQPSSLDVEIQRVSVFLSYEIPIMLLSFQRMKIEIKQVEPLHSKASCGIERIECCAYEKSDANKDIYHKLPVIGTQKMTSIGKDKIANLTYLIENVGDVTRNDLIFISLESGFSEKHQLRLNIKISDDFLIYIQPLHYAKCIALLSMYQSLLRKTQQIKERSSIVFLASTSGAKNERATTVKVDFAVKTLNIALPIENQDTIFLLEGTFKIDAQKEISQDTSSEGSEMQNLDKITLTVSDMQLLLIDQNRMGDQQYRREILSPTSMTVNFSKQALLDGCQTFENNSTYVKLEIPLWSLRITYSELFVLNAKAIDYYSKIVSLQKESSMNILKQKRNFVSLEESQQLQQKTAKAVNLSLLINRVELIVVDDFEQSMQYQFKITLIKFSTVLLQSIHESKIQSSSKQAMMYYFNSRILSWEPLIEYFDYELSFEQMKQGTGATKFKFHLNRQLGIIVTNQAFVTFRKTLKIFDQSYQTSKPKLKKELNNFPNYIISNQCGVQIRCFVNPLQKSFIIPDRGLVGFHLENQKENNSINIEITDDENSVSISEWNIEKLNQGCKNIGAKFYFIQNMVSTISNQKIILIQSQYLIQNITKYNIKIRSINELANGQFETIFLKPFETVHNQYLIGDHQKTVSHSKYLFDILSSENDSELVNPKISLDFITKQSDYEEVFFIDFEIQVTLKMTKDPRFQNRFILTLQPRLKIANYFPLQIQFQLLNKTIVLETEQSMDLYNLAQNEFYAQISCANYQSRPENFKLRQNEGRKKPREALLINQGNQIQIYFELYNNQFGLKCLTFYSKCYLYNDTEFQLQILQTEDKKDCNQVGVLLNKKYYVFNEYTSEKKGFLFRLNPQDQLPKRKAAVLSQSQMEDMTFLQIEIKRVICNYPLYLQLNMTEVDSIKMEKIHLQHFFILVNECPYNIEIIQESLSLSLSAKERKPLYFVFQKHTNQLSFQLRLRNDPKLQFKKCLDLEDLNSYSLQITSADNKQCKEFLTIYTEKDPQLSIKFIILKETPRDKVPYKITNNLRNAEIKLNEKISQKQLAYGESVEFAEIDEYHRLVDVIFLPIQKTLFKPFHYNLRLKGEKYQKCLKISPNQVIYKEIVVNNHTRHIIFSDMQMQSISLLEKVCFEATISLNCINISIIENDENPMELLMLSVKTGSLSLVRQACGRSIYQIDIQDLQLDDMSLLCEKYPVILSCINEARPYADHPFKQKLEPCIRVIIWRQESLSDWLEMVHVNILPFQLNVHSECIICLINYSLKIKRIMQPNTLKTNKNYLTCPVPQKAKDFQILEFDISSIQCQLSLDIKQEHLGLVISARKLLGLGEKLLRMEKLYYTLLDKNSLYDLPLKDLQTQLLNLLIFQNIIRTYLTGKVYDWLKIQNRQDSYCFDKRVRGFRAMYGNSGAIKQFDVQQSKAYEIVLKQRQILDSPSLYFIDSFLINQDDQEWLFIVASEIAILLDMKEYTPTYVWSYQYKNICSLVLTEGSIRFIIQSETNKHRPLGNRQINHYFLIKNLELCETAFSCLYEAWDLFKYQI